MGMFRRLPTGVFLGIIIKAPVELTRIDAQRDPCGYGFADAETSSIFEPVSTIRRVHYRAIRMDRCSRRQKVSTGEGKEDASYSEAKQLRIGIAGGLS